MATHGTTAAAAELLERVREPARVNALPARAARVGRLRYKP